MTERGEDSETQVRPPGEEAPPTDASGLPDVPESAGSQAVAEGAQQSVEPAPAEGSLQGVPVAEPSVGEGADPAAPGAVRAPAPPLDESAATPDRPEPAAAIEEAADERPELFVAGAFAGGLVFAMLLKRVSRG